MNPFPIVSGIFRDLDDIKHQLVLMDRHHAPIAMCESLPGRIAEGEAFLHPWFFTILQVVRRKFVTNRLLFATNGSMLDRCFLAELSRYRPVQVNVSLHSTRPEFWSYICGRGESEARGVIEAIKTVREARLEMTGTIVALPRICGWQDIERTYSFLVKRGAKSMTLYRPGFTFRTRPEVRADLECPVEEFQDFAERMKTRYPSVPLLSLPELDAPSRLPVDRIVTHTLTGNPRRQGGPYERVLWLASEVAASFIGDRIGRVAKAAPNRHRVVPVKNETYGGNIICAGLLMVRDFIRAGEGALKRFPETDLILVPKMPFDNLYQDLEGVPAWRIAEELGRDAWIVEETEGNFDPLLSCSLPRAEPVPASE
jgi:NifB/MoaA-like Fe-S oxidoreductase